MNNFISVIIFVYTVVSFGLTGVVGVSRLSLVASVIMVVLLLIRRERLLVPPWILLFVTLYLFLIAPALTLPVPAWEMIAGTSTVFIGTLCIGLALINNMVAPSLIAYAMLVAVIINIVAMLIGVDTSVVVSEGAELSRFSGLLGNSNTISVNFLLAALTIWIDAPRFNLSVKILSLLTAFYGIYVSGSRKGVILGGALLLLVGMRLSEQISLWRKIAVTCTLLLLSVIFYQYFDDVLTILNDNVLAISRFTEIFSGGEASFSERKWLVETGYLIWQESPILGSGLGQFATISGFGAYSHNNYIELLVSGGVIALFLFYSFYALIIYYAYKYHRNEYLYAILIVITLLVIDTAAVTFVGRSAMLFVVFVLVHFSKKTRKYGTNQPSLPTGKNPI